jgi:ubiquinone/menaquinone biosynthesis C-methylase UbiE
MSIANPRRGGALLLAGGGVLAAILALAGGPRGIQRYLRRLRDDHGNRPALWDRFYALDWGDTTTNNYGFAPAEGTDPQRFQHQMYRELLRLLEQSGGAKAGVKLLEVSCGRGGGLRALVAAAPAEIEATGLDVAQSAVDFCRNAYAGAGTMRFIQGNALELPFADASFDVLLNVEASNDYADRPRFFGEVARVLKPGGTFLYADSFRSNRVDRVKAELANAGFKAEFRDITANVLEACALDSPRRLQVIRRAPFLARLLFRRQLGNYAAVEGSDKYRAFADRRRTYLMTAATRP